MKNIQRAFLHHATAATTALADGRRSSPTSKGDSVDAAARARRSSPAGRGSSCRPGGVHRVSGKEYVLKGLADYVVKDTEITGSTAMPPVTRDTARRTSNQMAQVGRSARALHAPIGKQKLEEPVLIYPTRRVVVALSRSRWHDDGKSHSELLLLAVGQDKLLVKTKATGGSYKVPAKALVPDTEYMWVITVAGNELGTAKFRTLSQDALAQVERRRPSDKADFSDRLLFTLMLHEMGAVQEARESWARLAQERSDLPELAAFAK
jgi:hypothetical protein